MKILFVLENYFPMLGGVETLFKSLVDQLVKQGNQVIVLTNRNSKSHPAIEESENLKIVRVSLRNRYLFTFLGFIPVLRYSKEVDLIHTTSYNASIPAYLAAKIRGKKIIITFHEVWVDLWKTLPFMSSFVKFWHRAFERFILKLNFDQFVAVSNYTAQKLKQYVPPQKVVRIYNGIDYQELPDHQLERNRNQFLFFGRLGISKGLDVLLDAIALLKDDENRSFKIVIPKRPQPFFKEIEHMIKERGIQSNIELMHYLEFLELQDLIRTSHAVIIPSYSEGFCFAAVESIALGTPLISSQKGALKEVVSGKYIEMQSFSAIGLKDAILKAERGVWTEETLKPFKLEDTVSEYLNLYQQLNQY